MKKNDLHQLISSYYSEKLKLYGASHKGVDWGTIHAQQISFDQLVKVIPASDHVSVLDYGCGYGALYDYFQKHAFNIDYTGFDISKEMIEQAKMMHKTEPTQWINKLESDKKFDYVIASGILNVKLDVSNSDWEKHIFETLQQIDSISTKGFSFNSLSSYSDSQLMKDYLYYSDPCFLFDFCKKNFSKYVSLLHDYPKYEFTIIVRKDI